MIFLREILNYAEIENPKFLRAARNFFRAARNPLSSNVKLIILNNFFILTIFYKCKEVLKKYLITKLIKFIFWNLCRLRIVEILIWIYVIVHVKLIYFNGVICRQMFAILPSIKDFDATKYLHPTCNKDLKLKPAHPKIRKARIRFK